MALSSPSGPSFPLLLSGMSFDKKWELLKPHIKRLYIDEDRPLSEVIGTMKREFDFNAMSVALDLALWSAVPMSAANYQQPLKRILVQVLHQQEVEDEEEHSCIEKISHV
jgi:hypothetical protein